MADLICSTCGAPMHADQSCQACSAAMTAIALPETAARVKVTSPVVSDGAFSEGLPPMQPAPLPRVEPGVLGRVVFYVVAAGIVVVLLALLVPALQKVREAAARTQSTNNLKQMGLAAHSFHDANKRLPFNGAAGVTGTGVIYSLEAKPGAFTSGSWGFQIIPFIDQSPIFTDGTTDYGMPVYMCPGRGRPSTTSTPAVGATTPPWSDYVINAWLNDAHGGIADAADVRRTLVGITDGTANTIFFGHGQINPADYSATEAMPGYLNTILLGGTTATGLSSNPALGPVTFARDSASTRADAARGFGSPFPQGCLMCMCDATVRMFPYSIAVGSLANSEQSSGDSASATTSGSLLSFLTPTGSETVTLCGN